MQRIRICQLITELAPAGAERCVFELARRLDRERFEVEVAALRGGAVAGWLEQEGIPVTVLNVRGKWDLGKINTLADLLKDREFDILHTHLFHADFVGRLAAARARTPHLVHTVHIAEQRFRPWQFAFARWTRQRCQKIIAVSESARDHHAAKAHLSLESYQVIHNGIDIAAYSLDESARVQLRNEWNVTDDEVLVAFVGRLDHQKGLDVLLEAFKRLHQQGCSPRLVVAGDGPQRDMLECFIATEPAGQNIIPLGYTNDVRGVLSAADILAMPSRWEGFGLAAAEAMAAGLPVVATSVPGLKDVCVDEQTALLVQPDDSDALARKIGQLTADAELRDRLGQAGRQRVEQMFDISKMVAAHEQLYRTLLA